MKNLALQLRIIAVREWKGNVDFYESFLVDVDVNLEADAFLESSFFNGSLGDSMIVALSNALELPFIVFTTLLYHPILNQTPRNQAVALPIFLAHTHFGLGHYDALVVSDKKSTIGSLFDSKSVPSTSSTLCTCGKNENWIRSIALAQHQSMDLLLLNAHASPQGKVVIVSANVM